MKENRGEGQGTPSMLYVHFSRTGDERILFWKKVNCLKEKLSILTLVCDVLNKRQL